MSKARTALVAAAGVALLLVMLVGANWIVERRTLARAEGIVAEFLDSFGSQVEESLKEASGVLDQLAGTGFVTCSEAVLDELGRLAVEYPQLLRIGFLDADAVEICGHGRSVPRHSRLTEPATLGAGRSFDVVGVHGTRFRGLRIRQHIEGTAFSVAVTVPAVAAGPAVVPPLARRHAHLRIASAEGVVLWQVTSGELEAVPGRVDIGRGPERLFGQRRIRPFDLSIEASVPKSVFLEANQGLVTTFNLVAAIIGLVVLAFALHVAMRPPRPGLELEAALKRGEFIPYYQPVIDLAHGRLAGCEMLVRRRLANGDIVPPAAFIAQAEASGLALPMTRALMERCRDDLSAAYAARPELKLSINLFEAHFDSLQLVTDVERIFENSGVAYRQLVFEITERQPLHNLERAQVIIRRLQALGAAVALDDAGTGHAGLAYLQKLGIDILKIDKMFVDVIGTNGLAPIVDTLTGLGHQLGMTVVAEGVETFDQVRYLRALGVDLAQGYVFAPPLPAKSFLSLVEAMMPDKTARDEATAAPDAPDPVPEARQDAAA